ncbi:MAG TPA: class I SAM-dependent methyltransferase [Chitinophagaceae bacterium]|nr:class I SAM-dependent methyltransferase [Chitinophagaceae bacterium]
MRQRGLKSYLEIGVFNGHVFFRINSRFKIAVDPEFRFDFLRKLGKILINPYNIFNKYFQKTSDDFFRDNAPALFLKNKIEIALVDGMHQYEFALRDVENILNYLTDNGVIIMHDCNPATAGAARSFDEWQQQGMSGQWNGDVWKAIVDLRSLRKDINTFVLDCDYGLGVITRRTPEKMLLFSKADIQHLTYDQLDSNRNEWLNLQPADYANEYFNLK